MKEARIELMRFPNRMAFKRDGRWVLENRPSPKIFRIWPYVPGKELFSVEPRWMMLHMTAGQIARELRMTSAIDRAVRAAA